MKIQDLVAAIRNKQDVGGYIFDEEGYGLGQTLTNKNQYAPYEGLVKCLFEGKECYIAEMYRNSEEDFTEDELYEETIRVSFAQVDLDDLVYLEEITDV
jgi:hypothetical protein